MTFPDISQPGILQSDFINARSAASTVAQYAQAIVTAVPKITGLPDWFRPVQSHITAVQSNAQKWMDVICPAVYNSLPRCVTDFNAGFQEIVRDMQNTLQAFDNEGGIPTKEQRWKIDHSLNDLINAIQKQQQVMVDVHRQVKAYAVQTYDNHILLTADIHTVASKCLNGPQLAEKITAITGSNFLNTDVSGNFNVNIKLEITELIDELNADPLLVATVCTGAMLEQLVLNTRAAQSAVQRIADAWAVLQRKYSVIITGLDDATDEDYRACVVSLELPVAQAQWQKLSTLVSVLMGQ